VFLLLPSLSSEDQLHLEEWKEARNVLSKFDDRLNDLRKYGFSLITVLFTADSILIPISIGSTPALPPLAKLAVLGATLLLIVALRSLETFYTLFQRVAALRARVIERSLNIELTDWITDEFAFQKAWRYASWLYYFFEGGILILGLAILPLPLLILLVIAALGEGLYFMKRLKPVLITAKWDWTLGKLHYTQGEKLRVTFENLTTEQVVFGPNELWWEVQPIAGPPSLYKSPTDQSIVVGDNNNYVWEWIIPKGTNGVFQIIVNTKVRGLLESTHLRRKIFIVPELYVSESSRP